MGSNNMKAVPYIKNGAMIAIQLLSQDNDYSLVDHMIYRNPFNSNTPVTIPPTITSLNLLALTYGSRLEIDPLIENHFLVNLQAPEVKSNDERLYPHQKQFLDFTSSVAKEFGSVRILVGDDPRLGKSIQALTLFNKLYYADSPSMHKSCLILCPKSLIDQWEEYVNEWTSFDPITLVGSTKKKSKKIETIELEEGTRGSVVITNWESIHSVDYLSKQNWFMIVGDEAHRLKNHKSNISRQMRRMKSKHMLLMSATFTERTPAELWSPLNILHPEMFTSYWRFTHWFVETKESYFGGIELVKPKEVKNLKDFLTPYQIRRRAEDVVDMPETIGEVRRYDMSSGQKKFYKEIEEGTLLDLSDHDLLIPNAVSAITRRLQASIHPGMLDQNRWSDSKTGKLAGLSEVMSEIDDLSQVIVYSNFRLGCKAAEWSLMEAGYSAVTYVGGDTGDIVDAFQRGEFRVLCTTPQHGGIGLNLANADYIVYLNIPWSTILYRQSRERTKAIGKVNPVHAIHLLNRKTIDERVYDLVVMKKMSYVRVSDLYREMLRKT